MHASQELAHALEVVRQVDYLGGDPTVESKQAEYSKDSKEMLLSVPFTHSYRV
jgi:bacterioferritin